MVKNCIGTEGKVVPLLVLKILIGGTIEDHHAADRSIALRRHQKKSAASAEDGMEMTYAGEDSPSCVLLEITITPLFLNVNLAVVLLVTASSTARHS